MIPCDCGLKMYRNGKGTLKRTSEEWVRFVCRKCGETKTFYRKQDSDWKLEKRQGGKDWHHDDKEFMDAIKRLRREDEALDRVQGDSHGEDDLHLVPRHEKNKAKLQLVSRG